MTNMKTIIHCAITGGEVKGIGPTRLLNNEDLYKAKVGDNVKITVEKVK